MKRAPLKAGIIAASALFTVGGWGVIAATAPTADAAPAAASPAASARATDRQEVDEAGRAFARSFEREGRRSRSSTGSAPLPPVTGSGATGSGSTVTPPSSNAVPSNPGLGSGSTSTTPRATTRSRSSR